MFTNVSWGNYIFGIALISVSWYLYVGVRFYLDDFKNILSGKRKLQFRTPGFEMPSDHSDFSFQKPGQDNVPATANEGIDPTFQDVDNLVERLKSVISEAGQRKLVKEEFKDYLASVLKDFPNLKDSPFQSSISELIVSECEKIESISLSQMEAEALWQNNN